MRKTSVSLLPRGQWVCDKSRAFRVRKKKNLCVSASLRLKIRLGNLIPPKILHQFSIDTPSFLHRSDGPSMDYRWSIDGVSYMEKGGIFRLSRFFGKQNRSKLYFKINAILM